MNKTGTCPQCGDNAVVLKQLGDDWLCGDCIWKMNIGTAPTAPKAK